MAAVVTRHHLLPEGNYPLCHASLSPLHPISLCCSLSPSLRANGDITVSSILLYGISLCPSSASLRLDSFASSPECKLSFLQPDFAPTLSSTGHHEIECTELQIRDSDGQAGRIQFIQGTDERTILDVRLTKSRDGTNGVAIFRFEQPLVFDSSGDVGEITGFNMIDDGGVLQSVDVSANFVNGKPSGIEAKYVTRSPREWDRLMRFMERYSDENGLQFIKR